MIIINIFQRWNYFICLLYLLLNIISFFLYNGTIEDQILIKIYIVTLFLLLAHYLYCIFLESEFDSHYLKVLQLLFQRYLYLVSLMINLAAGINNIIGIVFPISFIKYRYSCEKSKNEFNSQRKCELYSINNEDFPYRYICPYNPKNEEYPKELRKLADFYPYAKCSDFESLLINNDEIFDVFKIFFVINTSKSELITSNVVISTSS